MQFHSSILGTTEPPRLALSPPPLQPLAFPVASSTQFCFCQEIPFAEYSQKVLELVKDPNKASVSEMPYDHYFEEEDHVVLWEEYGSWEKACREIFGDNPPAQLKTFLDTFKGRLFAATLGHYGKRPFEVPQYMDIIKLHAPAFTTLVVNSLAGGLAKSLSKYFPSLTSLTVQQRVYLKELATILGQGIRWRSITLEAMSKEPISDDEDEEAEDTQEREKFSLSCLEDVPSLELFSAASQTKHAVSAIKRPESLSRLQSLTLIQFVAAKGLLASLARLPALTSLSLRQCMLVPLEELNILLRAKKLTTLDLHRTQFSNTDNTPVAIPFKMVERIQTLGTRLTHSCEFPPKLQNDLRDFKSALFEVDPSHKPYGLYFPVYTVADSPDVEKISDKLIEGMLQNLRTFFAEYGEHFIARSPGNYQKNRYTDTFPYDDNHLRPYINMSPIRSLNQRAYYAAEGPKKETINDFWGAVIRLNVTLITMTTGLWENKKEKCAQYWPEKVNELMVVQLNERESATIVMTKKEPFRSPLKGFVQTFSIETAAGKREVVHLQVDGWLDKHPYGPENLWELVQLTDQYEAAHPGASIYHCSGGIGRTGTLLTCKLIEQRLWQIVTSGIAMHRIGFDLSAGIAALRQQRPGMVNTVEQAKEIIQFFMMAPSMWGEKKLK